MKVFVISRNYPTLENPIQGIFVHRIYKELKDKIDVHVILLIPHFGLPRVVDHYRIDGVQVISVQYFRPRGRFINAIEGIFALSSIFIIKKMLNNFDLIHGHWQVETGPLCMLLAKWKGLPFLISVRGGNIFSKPKFSLYIFISKWVFRKARFVHVHGKNILEHLVKNGFVKEDKLIYIPNIINSSGENHSTCSTSNREEKTINLLFVGLRGEGKGLKDVILAFNKIENNGNILFNVITDINSRFYRKHIAKLITNNKNILVFPPINPDAISEFFINADVFIFPSYVEGVPNVVLEAMKYKCYIISYDIPGIRGLIVHNKNGRLVRVGDVNGLAAEIEWYLEHKHSPEILKYQEYNQGFIQQSYNTDKLTKQIIDLYTHSLAK